MKIGIDVMGGDFAPRANILGAMMARQSIGSDAEIVLIGEEKVIRQTLEDEGGSAGDFIIQHAADTIGMGEHPTKAFMRKPESSLAVGFGLLNRGDLDVFAGLGNTGAMLVGSMYTVKTIPGVIRPCITSCLPKIDGGVGVILDVGTNADCKPDVLYQFGILGSIFCEQIYQVSNPKVGLLNIGEEEEKGNLLTQATHALMKETKDFNFVGNVEGRDLFSEKADVVVCDGYTGNVVLKEAEAFYHAIKSRGISDDYFDRFNYEIYGGTPILGLNSNVVIGHGMSSPEAIKNMIKLSKEVVEVELSKRIKSIFS